MLNITEEEEIYLNQAAQGLIPPTDFAAWWQSLADLDKRCILRAIVTMTWQAKTTPADIDAAAHAPTTHQAIAEALLAGTQHAASRPGPQPRLRKLETLPPSMWLRAIAVLFDIFRRADTRRRESCAQHGCNHWWHGDLSSLDVRTKIRGCHPL